MNKIIFRLEREYNDDLLLVANNHYDLEDYLKKNYDWYSIEVKENIVIIKEREGYENVLASIRWVKQI